jgi:uncharacterized membrane protein (DUF4010 family)
MSFSNIVGIVIAALGGMAIGIEREHSGHASGPHGHFAGLRTFTLLGGLAGLCGWLWLIDMRAAGTVLLAAAAALVVAGYVAASRSDVDGTTEAAALVVLAAGVLAGANYVRLASMVIAIAALLLAEKSRLHAAVARIDAVSLLAGFRFAVMAVVILPALPEGPFGPWGGIRPRELWILVLFFTGLNFLGFIARRVLGVYKGYVLAGILGGIVSSTNVTLTFARASRVEAAAATSLAVGVLGACTTMYPRVLAATWVLNSAVGPHLLAYLAAPFLAGCVIVFAFGRSREQALTLPIPSNPLRFKAALQMALLFQVVLLGVHMTLETWGQKSVAFSSALLGVTDVDALVVSMSRGIVQVPLASAAQGIAIGALANTVLKFAIGVIFGRGSFRKVAGAGLAAIGIASVVALVWLRP